MTDSEVKTIVAIFLRDDLIGGHCDEASLSGVRLLSEGIIDSLATLRLVAFLEERFDISIRVDQMDVHHLDTLETIAETVLSNKRD